MDKQLKSLLGGAAVAALLIMPSLAAPNSPPTPPAPPKQTQVHPMPQQNYGDWVTKPQRSFNVRAIKFNDVVGTITVDVRDNGPMTLDVAGVKERVDGLQVSADNGTLTIEGSEVNDVWDWHHWFDFSVHDRSKPDALLIRVTVPRGTDVNVDGLVGDATIGDTYGPLKFSAAASKARIGKVGKASIDMAGAGNVDVAEVNGPLDLDIAGSGKVKVGPTHGNAKADIAGSGDATIGTIAGGLNADIAGSGDVFVQSVKGTVKVDIAGSGSVKIADGEADPLKVDIMGSGNFDFGGVAVDPRIDALGSGKVRIKSYRGKMSADGMVTVKVGDKNVTVGDDDDKDNDKDNN
jgi:hypothetical protein